MAITYNSIDYRGVAVEPILEEILFMNKTVSEGLVTFETDIKAETIFTEASADAVMQAYTCGEPTPQGGTGAFDSIVTPVKVMYYDEYCPDNIRFSRFKTTMAPGAWNNLSTEYERVIIGGVYAANISSDVENKFWNNVTAATKTAVAGLTVGATNSFVSAAEKALVAATPTGLFDGIVQKMIYNTSNPAQTGAVGGRVKVTGATAGFTTANIQEELNKIYTAIPAVILEQAEAPLLYLPRQTKQMINIYDNNPSNFKVAFSISEDKTKYYYNGIETAFVPIPANTAIVAKKSHLFWATDLTSDMTYVESDKIANNRDDRYIKSVMTVAAHVGNQQYNVLYVAPLS